VSGTTQMSEIKTVILVHGALAIGSCHAKLILPPHCKSPKGHSGAELLELAR
jgi:hypothetical protein